MKLKSILAVAVAVLVLVLAVVQVPTILVLGPVIAYVFTASETVPAVIFMIWALLVGVSDTFLKPLMLGRGLEIPMLVILLGAIGGMLVWGVIGLFVGAVVLAVDQNDRPLLVAQPSGAGRVMALRSFGKLLFLVLVEAGASIQVSAKRQEGSGRRAPRRRRETSRGEARASILRVRRNESFRTHRRMRVRQGHRGSGRDSVRPLRWRQ